MDVSDDWQYHMTMKEITAAELQEQCLTIPDEIDQDGIVITNWCARSERFSADVSWAVAHHA